MRTNSEPFQINKVLAIAIFFICFLTVYFETIAWMIPAWFSPRGFYSHSSLLVALLGHLLWRERIYLLQTNPSPSAFVIAGLFCASVFWLLAWAANLIIIQIFAIYLIFLAGACSIFGRHTYRIVLPIFFLILFALPIWQPIQFILQNIATYAVQAGLSFMGIAVYVEGNFISIPNGIFEIQGGCSGIGFILVSLGLTGYLSLLDKRKVSHGIALLFLGGSIALLANWIRILLIILVGYYGGMDQALVRDHVGFGWLVFALFFFPYLYLISKYRPEKEHTAIQEENQIISYETGKITTRRFVLILLASFTLPVVYFSIDKAFPGPTTKDETLPKHAGNYLQQPSTAKWRPDYPTADNTQLVTYADGNKVALHVFTANYAKQSQGHEVIHFNNNLYDPSHKLFKKLTISTGINTREKITELILQQADGKISGIWYWYQIGNEANVIETQVTFAQIRQKLHGRGNASITAIYGECDELQCGDTRKKIINLLQFL
ncbi:MAG: EpsI family protein [Pseudomonadales bacterium]|nr:EpsI family protein [Pseudomonadales bacterium]